MNTELLNSLCKWDQERLINITREFCEVASWEPIFETGYNPNSWYVYIALENGVSICEAFNWVEYLVTNMDDWEEFFFDTYKEAEEKQNELNN